MAIAPSPPPPPVDTTPGSPWLEKWFFDIWQWVRVLAGRFVDLDFTGSNLTSILTRNHNDLQNIQGGTATERYHLTAAQHAGLLPGLGTANQVLGVNAGATATEYKTLTAGANITIVHGVGSVTIAASGGLTWQAIQTVSFVAVAGRAYPINSTGGVLNVTLPATPALGDSVVLLDAYQTFRTNNVTILGNGSNLHGQVADIVMQENGQYVQLTYLDATRGWEIALLSALDNYAVSGSGAPSTTDILNGQDIVWTDTTGGTVKHYFNNAGSLVSVTLS